MMSCVSLIDRFISSNHKFTASPSEKDVNLPSVSKAEASIHVTSCNNLIIENGKVTNKRSEMRKKLEYERLIEQLSSMFIEVYLR